MLEHVFDEVGGASMAGKRIVLLSDGTGNSAAQVWRTNVWRVFESLDLTGSDQVSFYDDGVGTSSFKPAAILGGAFGYGLKRNVLELYKFACRNHHDPHDEIFGFGFSRGAFTIRIVIALIIQQGLVVASSEAELHAKARAAYRAYRKDNFHTIWRIENIFRWIRDLFANDNYDKRNNRRDITIRLIGVWDTVAAYGMPIDEMARGFSQWIWPSQLPDTILRPQVKRACQALSIDDERTTFFPVLWDERKEKPLKPRADGRRYISDERVTQVWFAGMHANVGGGYPDDSVAQIPLVWILAEAQAAGLRFKSHADASPQTYGHPVTVQDPDGRVYDSRSGLSSYYRYGPRDILALGKELLSRGGAPHLPRVHESVLIRIRNNAHLYAPKGLPARYEIVTATGEILSPAQNPYEIPAQADARANLQGRLWNTIWWRRIVYFATVALSVYLFAFPLLKAHPASDEYESSLRWLSDVIEAIGQFLPSAADSWINGYARDPSRFLVVALLLAAVSWLGSYLSARIQSQMGIYWRDSLNSTLTHTSPPDNFIYHLRTNPAVVAIHANLKKYIAPALFALLFVYLGLALTSHAIFNVQDDAGWVCREKPVVNGTKPESLTGLSPGETMKINGVLPTFRTSELCQSMGVWLERNGKYLIRFDSTKSFYDASIPASMGFYSLDPSSWLTKAIMVSAVPLRRELIRPWFRVVVRIGGRGGEETFLDPDITDTHLIDEVIKATRDGELFLFVNDAVLGIPGRYNYFYRNNQGSTQVTIQRQ